MQYGSIDGVKDNIPKFAEYIKPDAQVTDSLDIKESTIIRYLTEKSAEVDAALAGIYKIPLVNAQNVVPEFIHSIVNSLAAHKLARRYWINIGNEENISISSMRKEAETVILSLQTGASTLLGVPRVGMGAGSCEIEEFLANQEDQSIFDMEDPITWQTKL